MIERESDSSEYAIDDDEALRREDMDAAARSDHLGALLDEDDRRRRANRSTYRMGRETHGLHVLAASALLPRGGFDHRALNAAPKSQRRR